jgi:hypothetical protein
MMTARKTYRVYDARSNRVASVPASQMTAYERWMAEESDRQAYRS